MSTTQIVIAVVGGYLVVTAAVAFIPAGLARSKGRSFSAWWGLGMAIGIFAIIPAALLPTYRCPSCREAVSPQASVCRYCRRSLSPAISPAAAAADVNNLVMVLGLVAVAVAVGVLCWAFIAH